MTESELAIVQEIYAENGFVVFACRFPKNIGEIFTSEDDDGSRWKVIGMSNCSEFLKQVSSRGPGGFNHNSARPYFYKAECLD